MYNCDNWILILKGLLKTLLGKKTLLLGLLMCIGQQIAIAEGLPTREDILIKSSIIPSSYAPKAGEPLTIAIYMEPQGEWHGYWKQPGDAGISPQLSWKLPSGVEVNELQYPIPETLMIDGLMNHVYSQPYALLAELKIPAGLKAGTLLPIQLQMQYLACRYDACIPERASINTLLEVGQGEPASEHRAFFEQWRKALPKPLFSPAFFTIQDEGKDKKSMEIKVPLPANVKLDNPHLFSEMPNAIANAAPQQFERDEGTLIIKTQAGSVNADSFAATLVLNRNLGLNLSIERETRLAKTATDTSLAVVLIALASAIAGGLLLNLMPCVFPILSIKALSLVRSSMSPSHARREAVAYTLGVVLVCMLLGGVLLMLRAGGSQIGWAFQLQNPNMIFVLLLLACVIAFNFAGLFELGSIDINSDLTSKSGTTGAFATGALAAFVATPCTGPFMAAALGAALVLPSFAAMLIFAGLGLGIALPFLLLGFIPALQQRLPKPGAWMSTMRNILAIPMFLTVLALFWVLGQQVSYNSLIGTLGCAILLALGLWFTGLRQKQSKPKTWLPTFVAGLTALTLGLGLIGDTVKKTAEETAFSTFNTQKLAELRIEENPVFLYITADWCITCKVNEQVAINTNTTKQAFADANIQVMRGDWTNGDTDITAFLEQHGRSGVPFYLWYSSGKEDPQVLPQILTPNTLAELALSDKP